MADDILFLTDKEIGRRLGLRAEAVQTRLEALERMGLPRQDPLFDDKRYWPAVKEFLDRLYGLSTVRSGANKPLKPDGKENW